jgi:hypothetical protein
MNWRSVLSLSLFTAFGLALLPGSAVSQQKPLVANQNILPDGTKRDLFGTNAKGMLILVASGHFTAINVRSDLPKFKSNNRLEGTPEENQAVVHGTIGQFGTWSVDEASKTLIMQYEGNMFPNLVGTESKRPVTLTGDELKLSNPNPGAGGRTESVYRRAK